MTASVSPAPSSPPLLTLCEILLLHPGNMPKLTREKSLALALLNADSDGSTSTAQAAAYLQAQKCFTETPATKLALSFLNRCTDQHP